VLWYERALKYKPYEPDIQHNLAIAKARRNNGIVELRGFFLMRWIRCVSGLLSPLAWGVLGILSLWFGSASLIWYIRRNRHRRHLWLAVTGLVIFLLSVVLGLERDHDLHRSDQAVVIDENTALRIAPDPMSNELTVVGPGEKVLLLDSLQQFYKVRLPNYEQGWLPVSAVLRI
jgi:hypothetical protein